MMNPLRKLLSLFLLLVARGDILGDIIARAQSPAQRAAGARRVDNGHVHYAPNHGNGCGCGGSVAGMPVCGAAAPATPPSGGALGNRGSTVSSQGCLVLPRVKIVCNTEIDTCLPPVEVFCQAERIFTGDEFDGRVFVFDPAGSPCPEFNPRDAGCTPGAGDPLVAIDNPARSVAAQPTVIFVVNSNGKWLEWDRVNQSFDEIDPPLKAYCADYRPVLIGNPTALFTDAGGAADLFVPRRCSRNTFLDTSATVEDVDKTADFCPPA